ncbi:MAG TPA: riboflavin synthase [Thiotrichaceae bacterium]|jgi:riboflavin synthase|nr:riboflavin synthase [Thiotrichaceae bacterium]HIM08231.1 riboflavin synthase [Gammaproteobacteria bacterium]
MFTGIIQTTGSISDIESKGDDSRFVFNTGQMKLSDMAIGDSISVNGVCLSIIEKEENSFSADLSKETLSLTTFSNLQKGVRINLEKAMMLSDRINGHMVSGHIDGVGKVVAKVDEARSIKYTIAFPVELSKFISKKGSISVDGVSLTVNDKVSDEGNNTFDVNIIPHTIFETIFSEYEIDTKVNIEVDQIARYLDQLISNQ